MTQAEYASAMRRLETIRNEALRRQDRSALAAVALREAALNGVFFGRDPEGSGKPKPGRRTAA